MDPRIALERVDITTEVSMMASCIALPRNGQLEQLYHIFGYIKLNHNSEMVFDPSEPNFEEEYFVREDRSHSIYGNKV